MNMKKDKGEEDEKKEVFNVNGWFDYDINGSMRSENYNKHGTK